MKYKDVYCNTYNFPPHHLPFPLSSALLGILQTRLEEKTKVHGCEKKKKEK